MKIIMSGIVCVDWYNDVRLGRILMGCLGVRGKEYEK